MRLTSKPTRILAPAKINICLEILAKRTDGYHEIRSVLCGVELSDAITITPSGKGITVTSNSSQIPLDETNLAYRAARLLMEKTASSFNLTIHLEKHIPVAAGLGGGSSDAAAVMRAINDIYQVKLSYSELMALGAQIGADVPFFLYQGPAVATGIGERLSPLSLSPPFWAVLITPPIPVSTAWAYNHCHPKVSKKPLSHAGTIDLKAAGKDILFNALEEPVIRRYPELAEIKDILDGYGAWGSLMSGSGSTVFGIFFDQPDAEKVRRKINADYSSRGWKIFLAKALI
ncbi:MAG: 4-(cytidine 5'-diphospho)-2-C-methyl-D-erythritol kinase [Deltaproteobacteria bacterium]|nr:4-(cytidine 5'-diphospho)-2-C-methyl-D-erythritol kinase [Deltaproteobacteria bacterium]